MHHRQTRQLLCSYGPYVPETYILDKQFYCIVRIRICKWQRVIEHWFRNFTVLRHTSTPPSGYHIVVHCASVIHSQWKLTIQLATNCLAIQRNDHEMDGGFGAF